MSIWSWFGYSTTVAEVPKLSEGPITKLPDFFPGTSKVCAPVAEEFFSCYTNASVKSSKEDTEAGVRGLAACQPEVRAYMECMYSKSSTTLAKDRSFRVQEEYRQKTN